jgi:hypothetical protein
MCFIDNEEPFGGYMVDDLSRTVPVNLMRKRTNMYGDDNEHDNQHDNEQFSKEGYDMLDSDIDFNKERNRITLYSKVSFLG